MACVEGAMGPRVELQEPGLSCFTTQGNAVSLTLPSLPPPITPEAAEPYRSPAVNAGRQPS